MYEYYVTGIDEIDAVRIRRMPPNRILKPVAIVRHGNFYLMQTKSGTLYANYVNQYASRHFDCPSDIKALNKLGVISDAACKQYIEFADQKTALYDAYYAAQRIEEYLSLIGSAATKSQKKKIEAALDAYESL